MVGYSALGDDDMDVAVRADVEEAVQPETQNLEADDEEALQCEP